MTNENDAMIDNPADAAYAEGRRAGLAVAALSVACVAFLTLLGMEKVILAIVLAILALRGTRPGAPARKLALMAIVVAGAYEALWWVMVALYHNKFAEILQLMRKLS